MKEGVDEGGGSFIFLILSDLAPDIWIFSSCRDFECLNCLVSSVSVSSSGPQSGPCTTASESWSRCWSGVAWTIPALPSWSSRGSPRPKQGLMGKVQYANGGKTARKVF